MRIAGIPPAIRTARERGCPHAKGSAECKRRPPGHLTTAFHARCCACGPPRSTHFCQTTSHTNFMNTPLNKFDSVDHGDARIDCDCQRRLRTFRTPHSALATRQPLRRLCHRAILRRGRRMKGRGMLGGLAALWFALFLCGLAAEASTITGNIRNTIGNPYATNALFTPLSTPQADGANIIASTPTNVIAATDGSFTVTLKQGNYKVNLGNLPSDTFIISVPNDSATYNLTALVSSQLTYVYPVSPIFEQKINK